MSDKNCKHVYNWVSADGSDNAARLCISCNQPDPDWLNNITMREPVEIVTARYVRKPVYADAVQVTAENMADLAHWANGQLLKLATSAYKMPMGAPYIKINGPNIFNERQKMAFEGDWVLRSGRDFKVFRSDKFKQSWVLDQPEDDGSGDEDQMTIEDLEIGGEMVGDATPIESVE